MVRNQGKDGSQIMKKNQKKYFPVFMNLSGRKILIIGAGVIAARRAGVLADFGADVTVLAPDGCEKMQMLADAGAVRWERQKFDDCWLTGQSEWYMVLAATDDTALNNHVVEMAREQGSLVSHAGDHEQCDFYFPAIVENEDLVMGLVSKKQDHGLVREAAARLRSWITNRPSA